MPTGLPWLLLSWFPIQFLFNIDTKCPLGCLSSSCIGFLFNSYSKVKPNAHWAALAPLVLVSYSILIQNWCQMAPGLPWLIMYWFPIQFSFKFDANAPWAALAPLVLGSYSILIQN